MMLPRFSVSDFVASVNQTFEAAYPAIEVEGEVSSFKVNQEKWVFFDLKDDESTVNCFMSVYQMRVPLEDGMKIIARVTPKVARWGRFSLTVQAYRLSGEGSLRKGFELLRAKLENEGLFALERKRILPPMPRHIGVISSTQAAGYADFIKILEQRWGGLQVDVAHVQVQGETAPNQMIAAIQYFNVAEQPPEVLVIIRGGGSADDLSAFNDEPLVRAIAASRIPTLVGVGHEVDTTLADLAADVRAATPSNAAQIIVPDRAEIIRAAHHHVSRMASQLYTNLDVIDREAKLILTRSVDALESRVEQAQQQMTHQRRMLAAYDPQAVLARGYAIVHGAAVVGNTLTIEQKNQVITAEVTDVKSR